MEEGHAIAAMFGHGGKLAQHWRTCDADSLQQAILFTKPLTTYFITHKPVDVEEFLVPAPIAKDPPVKVSTMAVLVVPYMWQVLSHVCKVCDYNPGKLIDWAKLAAFDLVAILLVICKVNDMFTDLGCVLPVKL